MTFRCLASTTRFENTQANFDVVKQKDFDVVLNKKILGQVRNRFKWPLGPHSPMPTYTFPVRCKPANCLHGAIVHRPCVMWMDPRSPRCGCANSRRRTEPQRQCLHLHRRHMGSGGRSGRSTSRFKPAWHLSRNCIFLPSLYGPEANAPPLPSPSQCC